MDCSMAMNLPDSMTPTLWFMGAPEKIQSEPLALTHWKAAVRTVQDLDENMITAYEKVKTADGGTFECGEGVGGCVPYVAWRCSSSWQR